MIRDVRHGIPPHLCARWELVQSADLKKHLPDIIADPYRPPASPGIRHRHFPRSASQKPLIAFTLGVVAYYGFVLLLLCSTPLDRRASMLLLLNSPVFLMWGIGVWRSSEQSAAYGVLACAVQGMIVAYMIQQAVGDGEAVVLINGIIIAALVAITAICWYCRTSHVFETIPSTASVLGEPHNAREPSAGDLLRA